MTVRFSQLHTYDLQVDGADEGRVRGYLALVAALVTPLHETDPQAPVVGLLEVEGEPEEGQTRC
ncbi:hypothetical protein E2C01_046268 [Portunus trituberculatus]|uniref:Uncharacterized protein n=1 Tax=Portunus trituberculatus TaxID=210409 RepID=A0A5B7FY02_PORTR|nr:hypothetical protein [Portunus trituberculatus]